MFTDYLCNQDILEAKGEIPYWVIALKLGVHENTVRNWMRREMSEKQKQKVLDVIKEIEKSLTKVS